MAVKRTRRPMKAKQVVAEEPKPDDDNGDDVFDVEKILDKRESPTQGTIYYVKWRNYPTHHNTWEPASNILNNSLIEAYNARVAKAKKTKTSTPIRPIRKTTAKTKDTAEIKSSPTKLESIKSTELEFQKFKPSRVINESLDSKMITFLGKYNGKDTVVMLEKTVFDEANTKKALNDKELLSNLDFMNDVYSSYKITLPSSTESLNQLKATVVHPASDAVIAKYSGVEATFFSETTEVYTKIVEPFISKLLESDEDPNRWVYNILEGKSEADRVLFNDEDPNSGFMLVESIKNPSSSTEEKGLELLAICHRRDIRSLRDLNDKHLTLLRNILTKGTQLLKDKYKKSKGEFRSYVHYHPSFYHFHVHFKMVDPASYGASDRDHLLSTIINNITINKLYYKKSTLTYPISILKALYVELEKAGRI